jgi:hypothetical protein
MHWLTRVPLAVVRAYLPLLPRLQAEESLLASQRTAVGSGSLKREQARAVTGGWSRLVDAGVTPARPASRHELGGSGIGYREVPRR